MKLTRELLEKLSTPHNFGIIPKETHGLDIERMFGISGLSKERIKRQFVDFCLLLQNVSRDSALVVYEGQAISLSDYPDHTDSVEETINDVIKKLRMESWQVYPDVRCNDVSIIMLIPNVDSNCSVIQLAMNSHGYFLSRFENVSIDGGKWSAMQFHPVYASDVTSEILSTPTKFLIHISPSYAHDSIMKNGLLPKSLNSVSDYPQRIYFVEYKNEKQIRDLARNICFFDKNPSNDNKYDLYQLLKENLPKDIKFYFDPDTDQGYYTYESIPISSLSYLGRINVM